MQVNTINGPVSNTNTYVIYNKNKDAVIVDICDCRQVSEFIERCGLHVRLIYLTHEHWDHIYGLEELRSKYQALVFCSEACSAGIQKKELNLSKFIKIISFFKDDMETDIIPFTAQKADLCFDRYFKGDILGTDCEFFELKGHSEGSSCLLMENMIFSGDTLLEKVEDIFRMPGSSREEFYKVTVPLLDRISKKGKKVIIMPGHGEAMDLEEKLRQLKNDKV